MEDLAPSPISSTTTTTSVDETQLLTSCLTTILASDSNYALCVMNSGLLELQAASRRDNSLMSSLLRINGSTVGNTSGTCSLTCTTPTVWPSSSCCSAVNTVRNCPSSSSSISYCRALIENSVANAHQCDLSGANLALIVCVAIIAAVVILVMVTARRYAKKEAALASRRDTIESRFIAVRKTTVGAVLLASRQVTNLVWKNLVIRRRKPMSLVVELLLPVLLTLALVFLVNLDTIIATEDTNDNIVTSSEAAMMSETILCTGLISLENTDYGAISTARLTFYSSGQSIIGLFLLISYIKCVSTTTTTMVIDKETRMREVMKIMGLSNFTLLCSWCLTTAILATPLAFVIAAELKYGQVFPMAEYATLVFLFWALSMSGVSFSYFIAPFFTKSRAASVASVLMWLILFFPFLSVLPNSNSTKYLGALAPPTAFALGIDDLVRHAQLGKGLAYALGVMEYPVTVPSAFAMSWFLIFDSFILITLGWYFDNVLPQEYGVRKPWNFLFVKDYWVPSRPTFVDKEVLMLESPNTASSRQTYHLAETPRETKQLHLDSLDGSVVTMMDRPGLVAAVEPVNTTLLAQERKGTCLQIRGLRKEFPSDDGNVNVAVRGLDLTLSTGQISALSGHNRAGKTTTISMLTGLIPPTSGDATLYGRSIRENCNELRQIMRRCPQHDVLFNELTVEEHLLLFGTMKRVPYGNLEDEVERMIREVGLTEKRKVVARNLSGGQKRKLSVALAFMGDSKLVFLDEPTSGMDPYSRRFTWNLLQRNRDDRVIVLTTHFMDEADILGDRIAIMADGRLCVLEARSFRKTVMVRDFESCQSTRV